MRRRDSCLIGLMLCGTVNAALGQTPFAPFPVPIPSLSYAHDGHNAVDMNGDGHPDLVSIHSLDLRIETNRGDGRMAPANVTRLRRGNFWIDFGDINEDGHMDVVCVNVAISAVAPVLVALGDGVGGIATVLPITLSGGSECRNFGVVDVNNDGHLDIALVRTYPLYALTTILGDGRGGFTETGLSSPLGGPFHFGDFNHDGWVDVLGYDFQPPYGLVIAQGDGSGQFAIVTQLISGVGSRGVAVRDTDGDGWLDIFMCDATTLVYELRGIGPNSFSAPITHNAGRPVATPQLVDVDLDGAIDLVAESPYGNGDATIFRGLHSGSLSTPSNVPWPMWRPSAVDFDGDGRIDLVSASGEVLRGDGVGGFVLPRVWSAGHQVLTLLPFDLDQDGDVDITTLGLQNNGGIRLNDGLGNLTELTQFIQGRDATFADFNGDGILDNAVVTGGYLRVALGTGLPTPIFGFTSFQVTPGGGDYIGHGDVDGDGDRDLVIRLGYTAIAIYENDGAGVFSLHSSLPGASAVRPADMNGDGIADLILRRESPHQIEIHLGSSSGVFAPPTTFALPGSGSDLIVVDVDGDSHTDVIASSGGYFNQFISVCRGDGSGNLMARVDTEPPRLSSSLSSPVASRSMGDTDGDGRLELLLNGGGLVEYRPATVGFELVGRFATGGTIAAFADLDGDNRDEVIAWSSYPAPAKLLVHTRREPIALQAYCTPSASTQGCSPRMTSSGSPSISNATDFTVRVGGADGQRAGMMFYGTSGRVAVPWAGTNGYMCVKSPIQRTELQFSGGTAGQCDGALSLDFLDWLSAHPSALGQPIAVGQTFNLQAWLREPSAAKTTAPSNALEFQWTP